MATVDEPQLVVVTGASGYLASHVILQLLEDEAYKVRGTVRSLEDEAKVSAVRELKEDAEIELVEADLTKADSWEGAVADAAFVIHPAHPQIGTPENEEEAIKAIVDGTTNLLKACQAAKTVKRVVLTSSLVAISGGFTPAEPDKTYTEEDWANTEKAPLAVKAKALAEKAAWDFVKELPDDEKFELVTINPVYMMGPVLCATNTPNMEVPKRLLERAISAVPKLSFPVVDVRDVAAAHIKALSVPEAAGQRHIAYNTNMWMKEIAQIIAKEFKPQGYSVPTMNCPYFALWMRSLFDKSVKSTLPNVGKAIKLDNTKMKETLGITPRDVNGMIVEMCYSLIEKGIVKKAKKYHGPNGPPAAEEEGTEKKEEEGEGEKKKEEEEKEKKDEEVKENGDVKEEKEGEDKKEEKDEKPEKETKEEENKDQKEEKTEIEAEK